MAEQTQISLFDFAAGTWQDAEIVNPVTVSEVKVAQRQWTEYLQTTSSIDISRVEHRHWDWFRKARYARSRRPYRMIGIIAANQVQGLMLISDQRVCRLAEQIGKSLIYVEYISGAPWNVRTLTETPRFIGVGRRLLAAAIRTGVAKGFDGRIGLHSLAQADSFYEQTCGTTNMGIDAAENNLRYFEMTPEQAQQFIQEQP